MSVLTSILAFLFAIALLVTVHEFGHYWVARRLGFKVERFSIGFGRPLLRWRGRGPDHVEYWLSALPLGGYVKLLDEREGPIAPQDQGRAFTHRPISARIAVLLAGVTFNFLFAILAFAAMFVIGIPGMRPVVGEIEPNSPAALAGLREQDRIVAVSGRTTATWEAAVMAMLDDLLDDGAVRLRVLGAGDSEERDATLLVRGSVTPLTEPGGLLPGLGLAPWSPPIPPVLGDVVAGGSAERAGLRAGDRVLSVDGVAIEDWPHWVDWVRANPNRNVDVRIVRDGVAMTVPLQIDAIVEAGEVIGRIGASVSIAHAQELADSIYAEQRYGPFAALQQGATRTWEMATLTLRMLMRMVVGDVSLQNLSGPIHIAQYAGSTFAMGAGAFLNFLAIVSLSLGVLNLLPVPMLDGGQIVYQLVEWVKGSPLSERTLQLSQQLGLMLLLVVMSFVFYQDIMRLLG